MTDQVNQQVKFLMAQSEAHKSAANELLTANLQLKTNVHILQGMVQESNNKIDELNKKLEESNAKIESLSNLPAIEQLDPA